MILWGLKINPIMDSMEGCSEKEVANPRPGTFGPNSNGPSGYFKRPLNLLEEGCMSLWPESQSPRGPRLDFSKRS